MDNRLISRIAREGGSKLLDIAVGRLLPNHKPVATDEKPVKPKGTIAGAIAGAALVRIATRSVPGAIVIGGGLLAKAIHERKRALRAQAAAAAAQAAEQPTPQAEEPADELG